MCFTQKSGVKPFGFTPLFFGFYLVFFAPSIILRRAV